MQSVHRGTVPNIPHIPHHLAVREAVIEDLGRQFANIEERSDLLEQFHSDTLNDISSGLNVIASGIRVITTILSLFGADTVDR